MFPLFATEDAHFIQSDDYFISDKPLGDNAWIHIYLAKLVNSNSPKGDAQFMRVGDGKKIWTKNFYTTRIANKNELKLGMKVTMLDASEDDIYHAPKTKEEARKGSWFMAVITDMSDLYKDYVTVSGGYKVSLNAIRVLIKDNTETGSSTDTGDNVEQPQPAPQAPAPPQPQRAPGKVMKLR